MTFKKSFVATLLFAGVFSVNSVNADYIERECTLIAQKFTNTYRAETAKPAIAVMPFTSNSADLRQRHIGSGVSELLTSYLVKYGKDNFTFIERSQYEKILKEQNLMLSGITVDSSFKIGQLIGAELIITGSVEKHGEEYKIDSKLVSVKNGQILASHAVSFRIDEFEKRAKKYIIPRKESIGLCTGWNSIPITIIQNAPFTNAYGETYSNIKIAETSLDMSVLGNRMYLLDFIMFDLFFTSHRITYSYDKTQLPSWSNDNTTGYNDLTAIISFVQPLTPRIDIFAGGGIEYFTLPMSSYQNIYTVARAGIEWRPVQSFGIGVFGLYRTGMDEVYISGGPGDLPKTYIFKINSTSIIPVISFYF